MEAATTDVVWGGLRGTLEVQGDPLVRGTWEVGLGLFDSGRNPSPSPPGAIRTDRLFGGRSEDLLLAANGGHGLGVWFQGTWISNAILDRAAQLEWERDVFPLGSPSRLLSKDAPAISLVVLAGLVDERPILWPITDAELALALWSTDTTIRLHAHDRPTLEVLRRWRTSSWTVDPSARFDAFSLRRGHLPGARPTVVVQRELAGTPLDPPTDPSTVAALGLSKAHELAWAAGLVEAEELATADDLDARVTSAFADLGITDARLVDRIIDELILPVTAQRALEALNPRLLPHHLEPVSDGAPGGNDGLSHLGDVIVHLTAEHRLGWWRRRGALLRALDAGLPHRLGSGTLLFRRGDLPHLQRLLDLIGHGVRSWPMLVDLVASRVAPAAITDLRSRGIVHADGWIVAHRAPDRPRATPGRIPELLDAATIEEHIDALSLARLWEGGQRDLTTILELHHAGLDGGDVERFKALGITDGAQLLNFARQGVDGYVANLLAANGHRHPDRWLRLSPYGAVPLDEWLSTFATTPEIPRSVG